MRRCCPGISFIFHQKKIHKPTSFPRALHKGLATGTLVESSEHKTTRTLLCAVPNGLLPSLPSTFPSRKVTERHDTCGVELGFPIGANTAADQGNSQAGGTQPTLSAYCVYHVTCVHARCCQTEGSVLYVWLACALVNPQGTCQHELCPPTCERECSTV